MKETTTTLLPQPGQDILVYKGSGGLTHLLYGLSSAIEIAIRTHRYLLIDLESAGSFGYRFDDFFYLARNDLAFGCDYGIFPGDLFFHDIPVSDLKLIAASWRAPNGYFVGQYSVGFRKDCLLRTCTSGNARLEVCAGPGMLPLEMILENLVRKVFSLPLHHVCVDPRIKLKKELLDEVRQLVDVSGPYIGIHFRNTDISNDYGAFVRKVREAADTTGIRRAYLATDDAAAGHKFRLALPGIEFIQQTQPEDFGGKNLHWHSTDRRRQIINCLVDMYALLNAQVFIPSTNSGLSNWLLSLQGTSNNLFDLPVVFRKTSA